MKNKMDKTLTPCQICGKGYSLDKLYGYLPRGLTCKRCAEKVGEFAKIILNHSAVIREHTDKFASIGKAPKKLVKSTRKAK